MSKNGIAWLPTKEDRQLAKLQLAETKRQATGTAGYRENRYLDPDLLPTKYSGNAIVNNPNTGGLQPHRPWKTTPNILAGLWRTVYTDYWRGPEYSNLDASWFDSQTPEDSSAVSNFSVDDLNLASEFSVQWLGYFQAPHTANYVFSIESDDSSVFWIGNKAVTSYTIANADIVNLLNSNVDSDPIALDAGEYYPIRVIYGNGPLAGYFNMSWSDDFGFPTYERVDPTGGTINTEQTDAFKLTVQSTSYEVEPHVNAQIGINDVLTVNTSSRGHTILAMTPTGTVIEQQTFDTWLVENIQPMQFALNSYPIGTVIAICTYDACQFHTNLRATLQDSYGATLTDVWGDGFPRHSHIFIGTRV
jgi:hypothetical protein